MEITSMHSLVTPFRRVLSHAWALAAALVLAPLPALAQASAGNCATFGFPQSIETINPSESGRQYAFNLAPGQTKAYAFTLPTTANSYSNSVGWSTFESNSGTGAAHE